MNTKIKVVVMLLFLAFTILAAGSALTGCAVPLRRPQDVRTLVEVRAVKRIVTGPAKGHWDEDRGQNILYYTVYGTDCTWLSRQASAPMIAEHGNFHLPVGRTLCMEPLLDHAQYVQLHAVKP